LARRTWQRAFKAWVEANGLDAEDALAMGSTIRAAFEAGWRAGRAK